MILDRYTEFTDAVAIPGSAGTSVFGDVIDLEDVRDIGNGQPIYWYVSVSEEAEDGTSVNLQLVSSDSPTLTSPTVHAQTGVIATANLTAGAMLAMMAVPLEGPEYKRYLGIQIVVVGTFTDGAISSELTLDPHGWKAYPEAVS